MVEDLSNLTIDRSLKNPTAGGKSRRVVWIVGGVVVALIAAALLKPAPAVPVQVITAPAVSTSASPDEEIALNATGYIVAAHKIELAPKIMGRVARISVDMGDKVKKGDELVKLEDDEYRARLMQQQGQLESAKARLAELSAGSRPQEIAQAQALLDQAQADVQYARLNLDRNRKLAGTNVISEQAIEDAELRFGLAKGRADAAAAALELSKLGPRKEQITAQEAAVRQAQGAFDQMKLDLDNTTIVSPLDGTILERNVEVGEYVTTGFVGDQGAKGFVVSIADLSDLRVELDIAQSDFPRISPDQKCTVTTDAYPDRKYAGKVFQISPAANRQKATVLVKVRIDKPDEFLRPDMNASVQFHPTGASSVSGVVIPPAAVVGKKVFVVRDGRAVEQAIEVGPTLSTGVRVTKGLSGGEQIIVNPPADLKPSQKVAIAPTTGSGQ